MNGQPSVAAAVTAGWSPKEDDPLAEYTQGKSKALIPIAGKPMIAHVVDALAGSRYVKHIVVVALEPAAEVQFSVPVEHAPDAGDILANAEAGLQYAMDHYPDLDAVLLSSSDVPTITPAIVDTFIEECFRTDHTLYYSIVERSVMEARFPESHRSYVHLREGDFAGGDLLLIRPGMVLSQRDLWQNLAGARKNALRQARMFGLWPFFKLVIRRLSLAEAERRACKALNVRGRAVPFPYAEVGMDVDKPFQLEIARAELEARAVNAP
ncbi:MAG: molybdenum cofactor guanylyltransferase [Anaerolineae bacterium]